MCFKAKYSLLEKNDIPPIWNDANVFSLGIDHILRSGENLELRPVSKHKLCNLMAC